MVDKIIQINTIKTEITYKIIGLSESGVVWEMASDGNWVNPTPSPEIEQEVEQLKPLPPSAVPGDKIPFG